MKPSILALALLGSACGSLQVKPLKTSVQKPANVAIYFTVDRGDEPVGGLQADQFRIYEDGKLVSKFESRQAILNPEVAVAHYTMLLVDMSASVTESGSLDTVAAAADGFAARVAKIHQVGVYAFDGGKDLRRVTAFSSSPGAVRGGLASLKHQRTRDPSTNLNGAIVKALAELAQARQRATVPLRFASLVVFTDGTDRAGYVSSDEVRKAIADADTEVFVIGLGGEVDQRELGALGKNGTVYAENDGAVKKAFDDVAQRIETMAKRYYLLSYCSPARAGQHKLTLEAVHDGASGSAEYDFNASGFRPDCDPAAKPAFQVPGLAEAAREARTASARTEATRRALR